MLSALRNGASGMAAQQVRVDVVANNIANINTTAFKRSRTLFADLVYCEVSRTGVPVKKTGSELSGEFRSVDQAPRFVPAAGSLKRWPVEFGSRHQVDSGPGAAVRPAVWKAAAQQAARQAAQQAVKQYYGSTGQSADGITNYTPVQLGVGVRIAAVEKNFTQGTLHFTGRSLDLGIDGDGFFKVADESGGEFYTRDGNFKVDEDGYLATDAGYRLYPRVELPKGFRSITVNRWGEVHVVGEDGDLAEVDGIELYRFTNPNGLAAVGNNLYVQTEASGEAHRGVPGKEGLGVIRQGYLEESNVELVREMAALIEAQRAYQANARLVETADQMWGIANHLRK